MHKVKSVQSLSTNKKRKRFYAIPKKYICLKYSISCYIQRENHKLTYINMKT